ncbi:hypothetical protein [Rummeliibacillus sp. POC4]|uniref:hypothetical protein n=1 Tax=Rummeliibacillus sp. POC4 TaxID=2305899 RepID=UPI000E65EEC0|nr:hypothetical protein [Rummeliibacillus sp. POC4]RIJ63758.1 hypothetical protein D1606_13475 [Rummeliibacillus sp. POC4]
MPVYKLSFLCVVFNVTFSIISFLAAYFDGIIFQTLSIGIFFLPPMVTFCGALLGIGAIVLKESFIKSITAIGLNIAYIFANYYVLLNF